ncbi:MAG: RcnB family protein [Novosphingobium sp.]|nr:RcnB family protein [Novosphingobium sp.]
MARVSLFQSAALAVLAAVGTMTFPAQAQEATVDAQIVLSAADDQDRGDSSRRGGSWRDRDAGASGVQPAPERIYRGEIRGHGGEHRAEARAERQQRRAERAQAPPQQSAPEGGWRSQRAPDGQRYGRNWDNNGTVNRPAPAFRGATPHVPERGTAETRQRHGEMHDRGEWATQRNRTYSNPNRNGAYSDRGGDRTAHDWRNRQIDPTGTYRSGYRDGQDQHHAYRSGFKNAHRDNRRWDRHDWRRDTRYNWSGYRNQHRDIFRAGRYYSPYSNYRYSQLSIGFFLDSGFYGNRYWINDPWQYRLPQVYGPYRWVRYYDDVLLVDIYSGEVVDVIHNFFW